MEVAAIAPVHVVLHCRGLPIRRPRMRMRMLRDSVVTAFVNPVPAPIRSQGRRRGGRGGSRCQRCTPSSVTAVRGRRCRLLTRPRCTVEELDDELPLRKNVADGDFVELAIRLEDPGVF